MDFANDLLSAVSAGLGALFPELPVYAEEIPEKVPQRCFLIGFAGNVTVSPFPHGGRSASGTLDITYLAPERGKALEIRRELNQVYSRLALELQRVSCGGVTLQLGQHRRTDSGEEGVLHDLVAFRAQLYPIDTTPFMGDISIEKEEIK